MTHCQAVIVSGRSCSHRLYLPTASEVGLTPEEVHETELVTGMGEGALNPNPASNSAEAILHCFTPCCVLGSFPHCLGLCLDFIELLRLFLKCSLMGCSRIQACLLHACRNVPVVQMIRCAMGDRKPGVVTHRCRSSPEKEAEASRLFQS